MKSSFWCRFLVVEYRGQLGVTILYIYSFTMCNNFYYILNTCIPRIVIKYLQNYHNLLLSRFLWLFDLFYQMQNVIAWINLAWDLVVFFGQKCSWILYRTLSYRKVIFSLVNFTEKRMKVYSRIIGKHVNAAIFFPSFRIFFTSAWKLFWNRNTYRKKYMKLSCVTRILQLNIELYILIIYFSNYNCYHTYRS